MPDAAEFLGTITKDFERLKQQKAQQAGGCEARMLLATAFDNHEQYTHYANKGLFARTFTGADKNKLHLVFNLIAQRRQKLIGRLAALGLTFKSSPDNADTAALDTAEVADRVIKALDKTVEQPSRTWELLDLLTLHGVCVEYVPWDERASVEAVPQFDETTNELKFVDRQQSQLTGTLTIVPDSAKQAQVAAGRKDAEFDVYEVAVPIGEVGSEILAGFQVFIDQRVPRIEALAPDQAVYFAWLKTEGWLADRYDPELLEDVEPDPNVSMLSSTVKQTKNASVSNVFLSDLLAKFQTTQSGDDPPLHLYVERYQPAGTQWPRGRQTCFIPGKKILFDGDTKYGEIPAVDIHFKPATKTFWTDDFITALIAPQRFLNKRMSQLGEQSNATLYANPLLGPGLTEKDIPADFPGPIKNAVAENGAVLVRRMEPPAFPTWFMESINLVVKFMNDLAGGSDLFEEHKFPGQLRGPMAVPMLQEIIDTEWGPLYRHLGQRMAKIKQMRLNRVKQFYPPSRTLHYTDKTQRDEVFVFHKEALFGSGTNYTITVEEGSLLPELRSLREARVRERLQGPLAVLYMDPRTGQFDRSKIAADLQWGDDGREGREAQDRKLARQLIARIWQGQPIPPVMPYYDHPAWLDELEAAMKTTEFLEAQEPIQAAFNQRWTEHWQMLQRAAQAQAQAMTGQNMQNAVAQATQQAAAQVAADTVSEVMGQIKAQQMARPQTEQAMATAASSPAHQWQERVQ